MLTGSDPLFVSVTDCGGDEVSIDWPPKASEVALRLRPGAPVVTFTVPDAWDDPTAFRARTEQVYVVPGVRPVTVTGEAAALALTPPGLQVAV
jgi:hypothetical protein